MINLGQWKFDGIDLDAVASNIEVIPLDLEQLAHYDDDGDDGHRPNSFKKSLRTRNLLLVLWVKQADKSLIFGGDTSGQYEHFLVKLFSNGGVHTLEQTLDYGYIRMLTCKIVDAAAFTSVTNNLLGITVKLMCPDPFWYNSIITTWSADINATPFVATIVNLSPLTSHNTKIFLTGRISDPIIENLKTRSRVKVNVQMSSKDSLFINCGVQTCTFNSKNSCANILNVSDASWFTIGPDANVIKITSQTSPSARLRMEYETLVISSNNAELTKMQIAEGNPE